MTEKPRILIVATGGTIASAEEGNGLTPQLTGEQLTAFVPEIAEIAQVDVVQAMNIDSSNMRPASWQTIGDALLERYEDYDGFVVLHGTDTMAYTAAALSYLIQDSPRPIVLTGSQQPMGNPFTDARLNLYQSVLYAADPLSRDVSVVFGGAVIAGTRARKQRTMSFNAFASVNYPELALIRNNRIVRTGMNATAGCGCDGANAADPSAETVDEAVGNVTGSPALAKAPRVYHELDERVLVLKLTPGISPRVFELLREDYDAIILETFGIGCIPDSLHDAIFGWVDSGHTLVVTTQVPEEGLDLGVYEVGRAYAEHPGVLKGDDMTSEALVAKTMWALGQTRDAAELRELFYRPVNHDREA
jgi:L-asparaginase